jgi:membrane protease YdiL (CAAX protease family)
MPLAEELRSQASAERKIMSTFDDDIPSRPPEPDAFPPVSGEVLPVDSAVAPLSGDPITYAAATTVHPASSAGAWKPSVPEDLRVPWSWPHFSVFLFFGFISLILVQTAFAIYYLPHKRLSSQSELEQFVMSKPQFAIGSMVVWYALLFLFLYVTLTVLRGSPFWRSLGWKMPNDTSSGHLRSPWTYFFSGCALSLLASAITAKVQTPEHLPIQDIFKYKNTALLFMAMAVLIAPLVEETIFRGYLYPLLAKSFGVLPGIVVTGVLFGLMHGYQLGWTLSLVSTLIVVGIIFTFVRARTGTVFASFLLHLGYNSTIAFIAIVGTKGFTRMPTSH